MLALIKLHKPPPLHRVTKPRYPGMAPPKQKNPPSTGKDASTSQHTKKELKNIKKRPLMFVTSSSEDDEKDAEEELNFPGCLRGGFWGLGMVTLDHVPMHALLRAKDCSMANSQCQSQQSAPENRMRYVVFPYITE